MSDWLSKLEKEIKAELQPPPKGWATAESFAARTGLAVRTAQTRLSSEVKAGKLQRKRCLTDGRWTWFYGPKN